MFLAEAKGAEGWGRQVVLKCLRPHVADIPEVVQGLIEEAQLAQRLQHGNIVQVFDFDVDDGVPFVVMEHVDGCTLRELIKDLARREERLPLEAALFVVEQVAAALGYAHRLLDAEGMPLDVVHRDVKPSNILLSRDGLVKLADFGIAKVADRGHETLPGVLKGTPAYWAPEQAAGDPVDARADVFGLGTVFRELVDPPNEPKGSTDPRVDDALIAITDDATATKAADRIRSMGEMVNRMRDWATERLVRPSGETVATLVRRAKRDKPAAIRVALDSALLSTAKGNATLQRGSSAVALLAPRPTNWKRPALLGLLAAAATTMLVMGLGNGFKAPSPHATDTEAPDLSRHAKPDAADTVPTPPEATIVPASHTSPNGADSTSAAGSGTGEADPGTDTEGGATLPNDAPASKVAPPSRRPEKIRRGRIKVNTLPWAEVSIDGKRYGRVPVEVSVPVGRHRIVLSNPSMGTKERTVNVTRGREVSVTRWPN